MICTTSLFLVLLSVLLGFLIGWPRGLTFTLWGCCSLYFWHKPAELAHSFWFCSCVYFCLYGLFNCISYHKVSRQLSAFSLCSFGLISALLVFSGRYFFTKVSFSPDIILSGRLGLKHELTNKPCFVHATKHDRPQGTTPKLYFCRSSLNDVSFRKLDLLLKET